MTTEPYDYTKLDKIILFKGKEGKDTIELSRDRRYINLIKPTEINKRYYRYDLKDKKFQRINFYKTTDDKITDVKTKNITKWFSDCRIETKDLHFGRLIIFAKFNSEFTRYQSPVRFIEQLGHPIITSIEQWEALGIKVNEVEEAPTRGTRLNERTNLLEMENYHYEVQDIPDLKRTFIIYTRKFQRSKLFIIT